VSDTFTHIASDIADEGIDGISKELRAEGERKHRQMIDKLKSGGCKNMESYADAVGMIRGLEVFLNFQKDKTHKARVELADEENTNWRYI
jgi:hypothetical protein